MVRGTGTCVTADSVNNGSLSEDTDTDVPSESTRSSSSSLDGGYGWVVCISGFFCWFIGDGIAFSYGVLYVSLVQHFEEGPSVTSWVGAAFIGGHNLMEMALIVGLICEMALIVGLICGPVAGVLVKKIGCRATVFVGSLIAALGFIIGMFSPNIAVLALTYGAMGGSGLNFLLVASVDMVAKYFHKRRALANGIVTCGAGAGGFIIPILLKVLIDNYDWDGSLLVLAGISLNGCILGALFRPLDAQLVVESESSIVEQTTVNHVIYTTDGAKPQCNTWNESQEKRSCELEVEMDGTETKSVITNRFKSSNTKATNNHSDQESYEVNPAIEISGDTLADSTDDLSEGYDYEIGLCESHSFQDAKTEDTGFFRRQNGRRFDGSDVGSEENIAYHDHLQNNQTLKVEISSAVFIGSMASISGVDVRKRTTASRRESVAAVTSFCKSCPEMFGFNLIYSNPLFLLVVISCTFWTAQTTLFIYLVDYAMTRDIDKTRGTILLSIIGIMNTIGRVIVGVFTDHPKVDCYLVYGLSLVVAGIVNMIVPFCSSFGVLAACSAVFGLSVACFVSLRAIIIVDFLGVDQMIRGFGLVLFCQGIGFLIGPPIAATIYEASGTYTATFLSSGSFLILAAVVIIPVRLLKGKTSPVT